MSDPRRAGTRSLLATAAALSACVAATGCLPLWENSALHERLSRACDEHRHADLEPLARQILQADRRTHGQDAAQTLRDLRIVANMISWSGRPQEGVRAGEAALAEHQRVYGADDYRTAPALRSLGFLLADAARPAEAERAFDRAAEACRRAPDRDTANDIGEKPCDRHSDWSLSQGYRALGLYEKAEPLLLRYRTTPSFLSTIESSIGDLDDLGDFYFEYGDYPKALWYYRTCNAVWESVHSDGSATASPLYEAGGIKVTLGNSAHAFHSVAPSCLEDFIEASERAGRQQQSASLRLRERLAWQRADIGAAERDLLGEVERKLHSDWFTPVSLTYPYEALGFLYSKKQLYDRAAQAFEHAHHYREQHWALLSLPEQHQHLADRLDSLLLRGDNAAAAGDVHKAEASFLAFAALAQRDLNNRHRWRMEGAARLAGLYAKSGRHDDALAMWERYLAQSESSRGRDHLDYAHGLAEQSGVYQAMGQVRKAEHARQLARSIRAVRDREVDTTSDLPIPAALQSKRALAKEPGN